MSKNLKKGLSSREKQFCFNYVNTGNIEESAIKAGYKNNVQKVANKLFCRDDINSEIESFYEQKKKNFLYKACSGYERLAFGNISDAIRLIYLENFDAKTIQGMDLFNVSEIKKLRDGAIELKFFDRIKALEKLQQMNFYDQNQNMSFYDAIGKGVNAFDGTLSE